jgi:signal transduction histidine kinase
MGSDKSAFIRQASHDIQGSFFGVSSISVMLKSAVENKEDTLHLLDHLIDACQKYKYKLNNFLEYTRFEAGLRDTIPEPVNIRQLLGRVVSEVEYDAAEKRTTVDLFIADDVPVQIESDEFRIAQIASNLLLNAIQFSLPERRVSIQVKKNNDQGWVMIVQDKGEGMTEDQLSSIFKLLPEERSALKNPKGLGLLVTRYLTEDILGGRLLLSSQTQEGTLCQVILPFNGSIG